MASRLINPRPAPSPSNSPNGKKRKLILAIGVGVPKDGGSPSPSSPSPSLSSSQMDNYSPEPPKPQGHGSAPGSPTDPSSVPAQAPPFSGGAPGDDEMSEGEGVPPDAVCYHTATENCGGCSHMEPSGNCTWLKIQVQPGDWCRLYESKGQDADDLSNQPGQPAESLPSPSSSGQPI